MDSQLGTCRSCKIMEETLKDEKMQTLANRITKADPQKYKRNKDVERSIQENHELSVPEGLNFREKRIVLQKKVVRLGHCIG